MKTLVYSLFLLTLCFINPLPVAADDAAFTGPPLNMLVIEPQEDTADVTVRFIPGTAFLAGLAVYESNGALVHSYKGYYGVGSSWHENIPVNYHFKVAVVGFFAEVCYFFDVVKPTSGTMDFWGSFFKPNFKIVQGEAFRPGVVTAGVLNDCPVPDYEPRAF